MRYSLLFLTLAGLFLGYPKVSATHIVGGEMNYRCLGNQQFEVILTVYRDCYYGVPFFDNPASVGVFDAGGNLVNNLLIPFVKDDTLKPVLTGDCFILPPSACVHTTTYRSVVTLPVSPGGYTLAYQRCCRNQTILNIVKPDSTGATFSIFLSEEALIECNSSPVFKEWPPIYICVNEPIAFDHSAIDMEGDSIVYRICTPLDGGTLGNPQPIPPVKPPYKEVVWRDPPYNLNNIMGGDPLTIDPASGFLTGIPNTIGQFVVGICADEFREGVLISSTRRDFQYNVGICGMTVAAFFAPEVQCGLTVAFQNSSANADQFIWYFDVENDLSATSSEANPVFTYPDSGTYTIMLIAQPNDKCVDTLIREIRVERLSIHADFDFAFTECADSLTMVVTDQSTDTISQIIQWDWRLSGPRVYTSQEQFPTFKLDTAGVWILQLIVTAANGCKDTSRQIFPVRLANIPWPDTLVRICQGDTILLNPQPIPGVTHLWSPGQYLSGSSISNPLAWPDTTITYTLKTISMNGLCQDERQITVDVAPPLVLHPPGDTVLCESPVQLSGNADRPAEWTWWADAGLTQLIGSGNPAFLEPESSMVIWVHVLDEYGCEATDSFRVELLALEIDIPDTLVLCPGEGYDITIQLPDSQDTLATWSWLPPEFFPDGNKSNPALVRKNEPGLYTVFLEAENTHGCPARDSILLAIIHPDPDPAVVSWYTCLGYEVFFQLETPGGFAYEWHFGDPLNPDATAVGDRVSHKYGGPGTYNVQIVVITDSLCTDTILAEIQIDQAAAIPGIGWNYQTCSDTAVIQLADMTEYLTYSLTGRTWIVEGFVEGHDSLLSLVVKSPDSFEVCLALESEEGCRDTFCERFSIPFVDLELPDSLSICPGDSIQLNPGGDTAFHYSWFPAEEFADPHAVSPWVKPYEPVTYLVRVDGPGEAPCVWEHEIHLGITAPPEVWIPGDTSTCLAAVFLQISGAEGLGIEWASDIEFQDIIAFGPDLFYPVPQTATFFVRLTDATQCTWLDSVRVNTSHLDMVLPPLPAFCEGDTLCLSPIMGGDTTGLILTWSGAGPWEVSEDQMTVCIPWGAPSFLLQLEGQNTAGCEEEASIVIPAAGPRPEITAWADPALILPGTPVQLGVTQGTGWTYQWTPAETLTDPSLPAPFAYPDSQTTFMVVVTNEQGCTDTAEVTVRFGNPSCEEPYLFVPNTFTPNGDGLNDRLFVRGLFIEEMIFIVYDRWGMEVFRTVNKQEGWDGTYKGTPLSTDVFGYYLEVTCGDGRHFAKKGNVTLLRN